MCFLKNLKPLDAMPTDDEMTLLELPSKGQMK
jgi:hypothetical protein